MEHNTNTVCVVEKTKRKKQNKLLFMEQNKKKFWKN